MILDWHIREQRDYVGGVRLVPPSPPEFSAMRNFRRRLPAFRKRAEILEAIRKHKVTLVIGGTGCGKTTQVCFKKTIGLETFLLYMRVKFSCLCIFSAEKCFFIRNFPLKIFRVFLKGTRLNQIYQLSLSKLTGYFCDLFYLC